jgi:serine/threonine protein kinase
MAVLSILCSALEYAHSQTITLGGVTFDNLVHRDLKPANVLISKKGIVKLTDFGLAKFEKMTDASVCGLILGTVPYMAPEHQKYGNVSIESDIYSLGVMFYEMLTGNRPFPEGDTVELDKYIQLKERATYEPLKKLLPGIDSNVARIVDKCLSPDKKDRYDSYTLLQLALDSALKNYTETRKDDIVSLFLDNKTNFGAIIGAKSRKRDSLKLSLKSFRIGIVATVIIGMVVVMSGFVIKKVNTPVKKDVPANLSDKSISISHVDSLKTVHNDSVVVVVKLPEPPKVNSQAEKPASINKITTKSVQNNDSVALPAEELTPLEIATDLFRKGDFDAASDILKKIDYSTQTDSQRDRGIVLLMESLFKGENYREAIRIANFYPVQDGKYFMILAFCQESMGMFNQAQTSFDKAINSSFFDRQSQRDAYLLRARFYQRRYEELRVEQLKTQMVQAWKDFLTNQCGSDSPECDEARNIVGGL